MRIVSKTGVQAVLSQTLDRPAEPVQTGMQAVVRRSVVEIQPLLLQVIQVMKDPAGMAAAMIRISSAGLGSSLEALDCAAAIPIIITLHACSLGVNPLLGIISKKAGTGINKLISIVRIPIIIG